MINDAAPMHPWRTGGRLRGALNLVVVPVLVGIISFAVLAHFQARDNAYRDARSHILELHEVTMLQELFVAHSVVMGHLTDDLPLRLELLSGRGKELTDWIGQRFPETEGVEELIGAFEAHGRSVESRLERLMEDADDRSGMMAPDTASAPPSGMEDGMDRGGARSEPFESTGVSTYDSVSDPSAIAMLEGIRALEETFSAAIVSASRSSRWGTVVVLIAGALLVLALRRRAEREHRSSVIATAERKTLEASEARFRGLVMHSTDLVTVVGRDRRVIYDSAALRDLLGYALGERGGWDVIETVHPDDRPGAVAAIEAARTDGYHVTELRLRHVDGSWVWMEVRVTNLLDDAAIGGLVLNQRDVTERRQLEQQLREQALHDPLTGLQNRNLFMNRVAEALARTDRTGDATAVIYVDLDGFKMVNDRFGHEAGDELLVTVARRLRQCTRASDSVARLGGDEFAILVDGLETRDEFDKLADRIHTSLDAGAWVGGHRLQIHASLGLAMAGPNACDADELVRNADFAMYTAKGRGTSRYEVYNAFLHEAQTSRFQLTQELREAVQQRQFVVHYQPIVDLLSRRAVAVEALVRWEHPQRGLLAPAEFIPIAEETGMISDIGRWVLEEACQDLARWRAHPRLGDLEVSVNVAAAQLESPTFVEDVLGALQRAGLPPDSLVLEITESGAISGQGIVNRLTELHRRGVRVAMDDFGIGYSSLSQLRQLPIDVVKIDRTFIAELHSTAEDSAFPRAVVRIGQSLGLKVVAEGIENAEQTTLLAELGCSYGQGYLFGRPVDAEQMTLALTSEPLDGVTAQVHTLFALEASA